MDHLVFMPWHDNDEILNVRRWLFPAKGSKDPDMRRKACSRVSLVWMSSASTIELDVYMRSCLFSY